MLSHTFLVAESVANIKEGIQRVPTTPSNLLGKLSLLATVPCARKVRGLSKWVTKNNDRNNWGYCVAYRGYQYTVYFLSPPDPPSKRCQGVSQTYLTRQAWTLQTRRLIRGIYWAIQGEYWDNLEVILGLYRKNGKEAGSVEVTWTGG